ncbi:hypothetical protein RND81_06G215500 [Saponaria officinalis]|uniref:Secreted protein n=1 Tax=Saponaria officinalis TaxID=3572 RepID=A0AAW1KFC8_SAPOF
MRSKPIKPTIILFFPCLLLLGKRQTTFLNNNNPSPYLINHHHSDRSTSARRWTAVRETMTHMESDHDLGYTRQSRRPKTEKRGRS